jgi:F420-dependent oxidoreductase-like protein
MSMCLDPRRSWADTVRIAQALDRADWHAIYVCDHFIPFDPTGAVPHGPLLESWTTLTALATLTTKARLGTLVLGNTYRHPAIVANMAATLDHVSNGRLILGLGAGWQQNEHDAYGIELPEPRERIERFEQAVDIIEQLLGAPRTTSHGFFYDITDATCEPKPLQNPLPLLIGGGGEKRTMRVAAVYADIWHSWVNPSELRHKNDVLNAHCASIGRDPSEIARATGGTVFLSEASRGSLDDDNDVAGTADEVVEQLRSYSAAGADEFIVRDHSEHLTATETLDMIERLSAEVIPAL